MKKSVQESNSDASKVQDHTDNGRNVVEIIMEEEMEWKIRRNQKTNLLEKIC